MKQLFAFLLFTGICFAQPSPKAYEIPFPEGTVTASNTIDLTVANTSSASAEQVKVEVTNPPAWLKFTEKAVTVAAIKSKAEQSASFAFSVEKTATVNKEQTLTFAITDKNGQKWTKDISVKVSAPTKYELFQNYPNPFNPTTSIEYQLPGAGTRYFVTLKIYDMLGREITTLVNEQQEPGYYQKTFNAYHYASGVYFYRLDAVDEQNNHHTYQKKMLMLK
jgi:hypothetical protein